MVKLRVGERARFDDLPECIRQLLFGKYFDLETDIALCKCNKDRAKYLFYGNFEIIDKKFGKLYERGAELAEEEGGILSWFEDLLAMWQKLTEGLEILKRILETERGKFAFNSEEMWGFVKDAKRTDKDLSARLEEDPPEDFKDIFEKIRDLVRAIHSHWVSIGQRAFLLGELKLVRTYEFFFKWKQ